MRLSDAIGKVHSDDFAVAVAQGKVPGWSIFKKFGLQPAVVSGTTEMWPLATDRVWQTSGYQASVVSDNVADAAAGTGARTVTVQGIDSNGITKEDTVTMNGTTPVLTTFSDFMDINRAFNVTAGSNEENVGNITVSLNGGASAYIQADAGQTLQTHYWVPAGKKLVVVQFKVGVGRMSGSNDLHVQTKKKLDETDAAWRSQNDVWLWNGGFYQNSKSVNVFEPLTQLKQQIVSTTSTQAYGVWSGFLVDETAW